MDIYEHNQCDAQERVVLGRGRTPEHEAEDVFEDPNKGRELPGQQAVEQFLEP